MVPENLSEFQIKPIVFNGRYIKKIYIEHVNMGKAKINFRSFLTVDDVLKLVFLLHDLSKEPDMMRGQYFYYSVVLNDEDLNPYKVVFCHDSQVRWLGIITVYRIKAQNEK